MSEILRLKRQIKNIEALGRTMSRQNLGEPVLGTHQVYSRRVAGYQIPFPTWYHKPVVEQNTGDVIYDSDDTRFHADRRQELDSFCNDYTAEAARMQLEAEGFLCMGEEAYADGSRELVYARA
jgi:hypothetical protein